ncbi:patatin-like phospholipase family protein [Gallaecimonas sp. GXIMD4217]|uniref:patatin-like phospholipase family protein n=1 Tax=Gallaecimonas sp. GXIMD4217 TaxID=3131927 RepID=UPI00311B2032
MERENTALVLTGGGSRAAYQVGLLKAISQWQPRNAPLPFGIITGTSAGAINGTTLACFASCFALGVKKLEQVWSQFETGQVYHADLARVSKHLLARLATLFQADYANPVPPSLLNPAPLRKLLSEVMDFPRIQGHINRGKLRALAVTASSYSSQRSVTFFAADDAHGPWQRAKREGLRTHINEYHLLASAALPLVFPSVRIKDQYFGDGTIHQLSPLSPAIHLGADRMLIFGMEEPKGTPLKTNRTPHHPTVGTIAGHLLDTIFTDSLNADLERLTRINQTLKLIPPDKREDLSLKPIQTLMINPSQNLDMIAQRHYQRLPRAIRGLLRLLGVDEGSESSLLSYLLFEGPYCQELMALGYQDAQAHKESLLSFLDLPRR